MYKLENIGPATYRLPKEGEMRVPGLIVASPGLLEHGEMEKPLEQVRNVACLPGIVGYSIAMPDMHWGYGFPIGGVAAMDPSSGVVSPGGVGYDINCGVRLALAPIRFQEMKERVRESLLERLFRLIPSGAGHGHAGEAGALTRSDYVELGSKGAAWSVEKGYGLPRDLLHIEEGGCLEGADLQAVTQEAMLRGRNQLGSIGSGNHFVEVGEVAHLFLPDTARQWGVEEGQTYILIHSGSRGFGHQVCQDTLNVFVKKGLADGLPDRQLAAAPIHSSEGRRYLAAMAAAANFAFNNRQRILHFVRQAFLELFALSPEEIRLLYDVCHNIAKFETHLVDGAPRRLCVHRKGATRALGPGAGDLASLFKGTGQPVLVPGDMGRASHLMAGLGNPLTWCSACHGAGRARSRRQSERAWGRGGEAVAHMRRQGVLVRASSSRTVSEEMPDAYKDVDLVAETVEEAGLAKRVARLRPHLVLKG